MKKVALIFVQISYPKTWNFYTKLDLTKGSKSDADSNYTSEMIEATDAKVTKRAEKYRTYLYLRKRYPLAK